MDDTESDPAGNLDQTIDQPSEDVESNSQFNANSTDTNHAYSPTEGETTSNSEANSAEVDDQTMHQDGATMSDSESDLSLNNPEAELDSSTFGNSSETSSSSGVDSSLDCPTVEPVTTTVSEIVTVTVTTNAVPTFDDSDAFPTYTTSDSFTSTGDNTGTILYPTGGPFGNETLPRDDCTTTMATGAAKASPIGGVEDGAPLFSNDDTMSEQEDVAEY
ncbi:MAG: hypothetical protein Q9180_008422 [Flavoplaca navasiana]